MQLFYSTLAAELNMAINQGLTCGVDYTSLQNLKELIVEQQRYTCTS